MDAHDLFYQLTRGARFTKKQKESKKVEPKVQQHNKIEEDKSDGEVESTGEHAMVSLVDLANDAAEEDSSTPFKFLEGACAGTSGKKLKFGQQSDAEKQKRLVMEQLAELRKAHRITVFGKNIPPPIESFEELKTRFDVPEQIVKNLASNYPHPSPIQMQAIPILLTGRPLMACAPTGSGKTIAFLTPIIKDLGGPKKEGFRAIVLAPTRELAQQIFRECLRLAERTALKIHIISKVNQAEKKFGPNSNKKFDILISTPNRVRFLLQQEPPLLELKSIEWIIIDEADRLMEEGQNNFKDQLDDILAACSNPNKKVALFSATYTVPVAKWALRNLKNLARVTIGQQNSATELVNQELLFVGSESGKLLAVRDLVQTGLKPPVLVFVQSKDRAKQLFEELLYDGINVDVIHADRTQQQRDNCVRAFREGNIWVLICTELMGRGIDFKGVNLVINYDFPPSTISYIHRIGRTGRAGRPGRAITFFTQNDTSNLRSIAQIIKNSGGKVPDFMLKMKRPRKTEQKKLENFAPKRDDISTRLKPEAERQDKLNKLGQFVRRRLSAEQTQNCNEKTGKHEKILKNIAKFEKSNDANKEKQVKNQKNSANNQGNKKLLSKKLGKKNAQNSKKQRKMVNNNIK